MANQNTRNTSNVTPLQRPSSKPEVKKNPQSVINQDIETDESAFAIDADSDENDVENDTALPGKRDTSINRNINSDANLDIDDDSDERPDFDQDSFEDSYDDVDAIEDESIDDESLDDAHTHLKERPH